MDNLHHLLETSLFAAVATVDEQGNPWNMPTFYVYDKDLNLYWSSHPDSKHSINIEKSGKAFITIYNSLVYSKAIYIEADVNVLSDASEIKSTLNLINERKGREYATYEDFIDTPQRLYKACPLHIWTNESSKNSKRIIIKDYRVEITKSDLL